MHHIFTAKLVPHSLMSPQISATYLCIVRSLTSAEASHAHVVRWHHLLLDRKVVSRHAVEGRVPEDDRSRVFTLIFEGQQFFWADGMKCLVGLCDEAGLWVFRRRDTLSVLNTIAWSKQREMSVDRKQRRKASKEQHRGGRSILKGVESLSLLCWAATEVLGTWIVQKKI